MKRVLVTRPQPDAEETAGRVRALGCEPDVMPLMDMHVITSRLPEGDGLGGVLLTSANAVRALVARDAVSAYRHLTVHAVGEKTASSARAAGFERVLSANGDVDALVGQVKASGCGGTLFYPAAADVARDLAKALAPAGILVIAARVYEVRPIARLPERVLTSLADGEYSAALFYSRRTAGIFCELTELAIPPETRRRLSVICLSENVAAPLVDAGFARVILADYPSEEAMMAATLSFARGQSPA